MPQIMRVTVTDGTWCGRRALSPVLHLVFIGRKIKTHQDCVFISYLFIFAKKAFKFHGGVRFEEELHTPNGAPGTLPSVDSPAIARGVCNERDLRSQW